MMSPIGTSGLLGIPTLNNKIEDPLTDEPDYVSKVSNTKRLLETWKKGQRHLENICYLFDKLVRIYSVITACLLFFFRLDIKYEV